MSFEKITIKKTCDCGTEFETERDPEWKWSEKHECDSCRDRHDAEQKLAEAEQKLAEAIARSREQIEKRMDEITPPRMSATATTDRRFNGELWRLVEPWQPDGEKPWLGLVGEPGACKTRIAFLKARQLADRMAEEYTTRRMVDKGRWRDINIEETDSDKFQQTARDLTSREKVSRTTADWRTVEVSVSSIARNWIEAMKNADILIFDELGKLASSPAVSAAAFALINHRHRNNLITIWTSNATPEKFCASWPEEFAVPAAGRLIETSTIFTV